MKYTEDFLAFWKAYPRKQEKRHVFEKCWLKIIKDEDPADIIKGAENFAAHCLSEGTDRKFIKLPATWLNRGCWEDEYDIPTQSYTSGQDATHKARVAGFHKTGMWREEWGEKPNNVVQMRG